MEGEAPASSAEAVERETAERRRERRRTLVQAVLDWSPVLARLTTIVMQHLS
ncbi:hypothetical protein ACF1GS_18630 [Streptomyces eurythermus]|uniref:hypothetical protein n=1 Tax=Streptomyces eurythermus TaxID=42237 RepID=UPI0036FFF78B